jgi:hypothetical protein
MIDGIGTITVTGIRTLPPMSPLSSGWPSKVYGFLRMGRIAAKPIPIRHRRVVDYAFHPDRSDFLDIWLFAIAVSVSVPVAVPIW